MTLYGGIDLHSNNSLIALLDDHDRVIYEKRMPNALGTILTHLAPYQVSLAGLVVESTYNWSWLVDGLLDAGSQVHLANTAAIKQYEGLKATNDRDDARWLAHLLRLGILPAGYIYPKEDRAIRDLLRKRAQLVRQKVTQMLSIQSQWTRHTGRSLSAHRIRQLTEDDVARALPDTHVAAAVQSKLTVLRCLEKQIHSLERLTKTQTKPKRELALLKTVPGIGDILALTIVLETGTITRFATGGQFASYCRCMASQRLSNGKVKGHGKTKNGHKYLAWAFVEATNFAVRFDPHIKRFSQRKVAATPKLVAIKTVAHKLARACYYMLREQVPFEKHTAFGL